MKYHAPTNAFTFEPSALRSASDSLMYAIRSIREMAGRPLTPYQRTSALEADDHAMKGIIDAAAALGIDLGARWGNELDVSRT